MRTLVTADLHLSANRRDLYRVRTLRSLAKIAKRAGVGQTIILGDLTEEKDRHSDWLVNKVVEIVRLFAELGVVYILQGNHDYASDPDCPFFGFLRHLPQVRWIGQPTSFVTKGLGRVMWLPHSRNYKKDWHGLPFRDHALFFAHGAFEGAHLGNNRTVEGGGVGIPRSIFPKRARVISGDIHIPHRIGCVEYVGAPYSVDFGDWYEPQALILHSGDVEDTVITLNHLPQKRLVEVMRVDDLDRSTDVCPGDILKVRVQVRRKDASSWPDMREAVKEWVDHRGCTLHSVVPVMIEAPGKRVEVKAVDVKDDGTIMREFARHRGVDKGTLREGEKLL